MYLADLLAIAVTYRLSNRKAWGEPLGERARTQEE
jgi:hypothetical protein